MNRVVEYASQSSLPRSGEQAQDLIRCLATGSSPAAHFADDLAKARSLAAASPPATAVAGDSRDSAEVAIRAAGIDVVNFGCNSCGSPAPRPIPLPPIEWKHIALAPGSEWDGTIGTTPFAAAYRSGRWDVDLNVC